MFGNHKGPYTLVVAVEMVSTIAKYLSWTYLPFLFQKTEALAYQLGSRLCDDSADAKSSPEAAHIQNILKHSTIVLLPDIPHTQINCHDYPTIAPFIGLLSTVQEVIPEVDYVLMLASGGLKVRYIDVDQKMSKDSLALELAHLYVENQDVMKQVSILQFW